MNKRKKCEHKYTKWKHTQTLYYHGETKARYVMEKTCKLCGWVEIKYSEG